MEAARPLFEAQKKANPSLTWSQFFDNTVAADRQLWRDPNYADRLAAASGMPVTPLQKEAAAITRQADARVASFEAMQASGELPQLERYAPAMLQIMQSKEFVRTNDERLDLRRAHRIAELKEIEHNRAVVEKANRAAPVRSSGGHASHTAQPARGGLDTAIGAALDVYGA